MNRQILEKMLQALESGDLLCEVTVASMLREELAKPDQPKQGWKLVPIDPTPTMKTAGINVDVYSDGVDGNVLNWAEAEAVYKAMIAAAQ